jgi:hypothetical protein
MTVPHGGHNECYPAQANLGEFVRMGKVARRNLWRSLTMGRVNFVFTLFFIAVMLLWFGTEKLDQQILTEKTATRELG